MSEMLQQCLKCNNLLMLSDSIRIDLALFDRRELDGVPIKMSVKLSTNVVLKTNVVLTTFSKIILFNGFRFDL